MRAALRTESLVAADQAEADDVRAKLVKLMGPLELRTEEGNERITIDADEMAREFLQNHSYLIGTYFHAAAGQILVTAHEMIRAKPWHDRSPILEFLRHCRNAAGHNWHLSLAEAPSFRLARWGTLQVTSADNGRPLFNTPMLNTPERQGLLSAGDPVRLLWDIEQAYPQMTV